MHKYLTSFLIRERCKHVSSFLTSSSEHLLKHSSFSDLTDHYKMQFADSTATLAFKLPILKP